MKQDNAFKYEVASGEVITIKVIPTGVGAFVAAARDGAVMSPEPGTENTTPTYVFTADDSSMVMMEFSFPGAPATASVLIEIDAGIRRAIHCGEVETRCVGERFQGSFAGCHRPIRGEHLGGAMRRNESTRQNQRCETRDDWTQ